MGDQKKIKVDVNLATPGPAVIGAILTEATKSNRAGQVAEILVVATLQLRYPDLRLGTSSDLIVGDTIFHVTTAPMPAVLDKCADNLKQNYRVYLLVPDARLALAHLFADYASLTGKIGILAIEAFVGQNIEEMGAFQKAGFATELRGLLDIYNRIIGEVETDMALKIEIPENLE
jgi:hypothetical protein